MQAYDLEKSFEKGQLGCEHKALYDAAGNKVGSIALWEAGADAYHLLQSKFASPTEDSGSVADIDARFKVMQQMVAQYLDEEVAVALREDTASERHRTAALSWKSLDLPSKALFLLELLDAGQAPRAERPGFYDFLRITAAVALLMRLNDAILSQDRPTTIDAVAARAKRQDLEAEIGLTTEQSIMAVATFRRVIHAEHSASGLLREARKQSVDRARAGALARAAAFKEARAFAEAEWRKYRADYKANRSAFARDYARIIANELHIKVKERTICEWLAAA